MIEKTPEQLMNDLVAMHRRNMRLEAQAAEHHQAVALADALQRISQTMQVTHDYRIVFNAILELIPQVIAGSVATMVFLDPSLHYRDDLPTIDPDYVVAQPLLVEDDYVMAPIHHQGDAVAVLVALKEHLKASDLGVLVTLASQAGIALETNRLEQQRLHEEAKAQRFVESAPVPVLITRAADGMMLYANPLFTAATGYDTAINSQAPDIYAEDQGEMLKRLRRDGRLRDYEARIERADGSAFWGRISLDFVDYKGERAVYTAFSEIPVADPRELPHFEGEPGDDTVMMTVTGSNRFRQLLDAAPVAVMVTRVADGVVLHANEDLGSMLNVSAMELVGKTMPNFYADPVYRQQSYRLLEREGHVDGLDVQLRTHDDTLFWAQMSMQRFDFGGEEAVITILFDVSDYKEQEKRLRDQTGDLEKRSFELTQRLEKAMAGAYFAEEALARRGEIDRLLQGVANHFSQRDLDDAVDDALEAVTVFTGADRAYLFEFEGERFSATHEFCSVDGISFFDSMQDVAQGTLGWVFDRIEDGQGVRIDRVMDLPPEATTTRAALTSMFNQSVLVVPIEDGTTITGAIAVNAVFNERNWTEDDETLLRLVGEIVAIGQAQRATEIALADIHSLLETVLNTVPVEVFWKDRDHVYRSANDLYALNYAPGIVGLDDFDLLRSREQARTNHQIERQVMDTGVPFIADRVPRKRYDGVDEWLRVARVPVHNWTGEVIGVLGAQIVQNDVVQLEATLADKRHHLDLIHDAVPLWNWNVQSGEINASAAYYRMLGYTPDAFPMNFDAQVHPEDRQQVVDTLEAYLTQERPDYDIVYRLRCADGSYIRVNDQGSIIAQDTSGLPLFMIGMYRPVMTGTNHRLPPVERLQNLIQLADQSNIRDIKTEIDLIENDFDEFVEKLRHFARYFQVDAIRSYVKQFLP
jgi:PAS domain S-box-containing protein